MAYARRQARDLDILHHGHPCEGTRKLEGACDAAVDDLVRSEPSERSAVEPHAATIGADESGQQIEHGRLAGAVWSQDAGNRAGLQSEGNVLDGVEAAETLVQPLY